VAKHFVPIADFSELASGRASARISLRPRRTTAWSSAIKYVHGCSLLAHGVSTGTRTVTVVPTPGELEICTSPPQYCARSFMPRSPKDPREFDKSDSQKPIPSSLTTRRNVLLFLAQGYTHRLCLRVSDNVGQTLLENSESRSGSISIQVQIDRWNGDLAMTPLREANSLACHSMAAAKPRSSSTPGRTRCISLART